MVEDYQNAKTDQKFEFKTNVTPSNILTKIVQFSDHEPQI